MIGKISGIVDYKGLDHVLIDVRGVGYIVYCSDRVMATIPPIGQAVALYTDLLVREDLMQLFGFSTLVEKEWHRLLTGVQGIGPKASLAILGTLGPEGVSRAIALEDWSAIARAKGVGPKTAQKAILELKGKAPSVMAMTGTEATVSDDVIEAEPAPKPRTAPPKVSSAQPEALSALQNLGYSPSDAAGAVAQALNDTPDLDTSQLIRAALKLLAPKG
ncbi:MAG: Holliday junction branch migration protein RuvA [Marivivens sp.]|jgi:Holliday junction DNA helicase RuvA|nr:Holliday junction branch migration protein RuvA [Marivivens sp.]